MDKEEFKAKAKQSIDDVDQKINELKEKSQSVEANSKQKFQDALKTTMIS